MLPAILAACLHVPIQEGHEVQYLAGEGLQTAQCSIKILADSVVILLLAAFLQVYSACQKIADDRCSDFPRTSSHPPPHN